MENERGGVSYRTNQPKAKKFYVQFQVIDEVGGYSECEELNNIVCNLGFSEEENTSSTRTLTIPYSTAITELEYEDNENYVHSYFGTVGDVSKNLCLICREDDIYLGTIKENGDDMFGPSPNTWKSILIHLGYEYWFELAENTIITIEIHIVSITAGIGGGASR